jgi:hypothetical protein
MFLRKGYKNGFQNSEIVIYPINDADNWWHCVFEGNLSFLVEYHSGKLYGTADEIKMQVDDFLLRMSKLTAFA